jgi:progressive ankylosis protein
MSRATTTHYLRFSRFMLPLAITAVVFELGSQVLNGGMARTPRATETLAAYGLAWGLILFATSPLAQAKELGLALVDSPAALVKVRSFVMFCGVLLMGALGALTLTPAGDWVIEGLHGIDPGLGATVRTALFWLMPFPLLKSLALFYTGLLLRMRRTAIVGYATISSLTASILAVFILLPLPYVQREPILLPILVTYVGVAVELSIILWGSRRHRTLLYRAAGPDATPLRYREIMRFFWPLALIMIVQEFSRPLVNLFVSRGPDATAALAILAVVYTLGRIPYGWLNELRNLAPAFRDEPEGRAALPRFALACSLVSLAFMVLLFWTPLRDLILQGAIGVSAELAAQARVPLYLFAGFSIAVTIRAYYHGEGLVERRTRAMAPSAPARFLAVLATLLLLPWAGITGATLGVAALLAGFCMEAFVVWFGVRGPGWGWQRKKRAHYAA